MGHDMSWRMRIIMKIFLPLSDPVEKKKRKKENISASSHRNLDPSTSPIIYV